MVEDKVGTKSYLGIMIDYDKEKNFDKFTENLSAGTIIDAEIVSISDTGIYMKIQNNMTASLKLLQKELR